MTTASSRLSLLAVASDKRLPSYRLRQLAYGISLRREILEFYNFQVKTEACHSARDYITALRGSKYSV